MKEGVQIELKDGREVAIDDDKDLVYLKLNGNPVFTMEYPDNGYGGGILFLSPSEHYLIYSYFSGQSEDAFILFLIEGNSLEKIYDVGYSYGEGSIFCFTEDEKIIFQARRTNWWDENETGKDAENTNCYEFGELNRLNIDERIYSINKIYVYPPNDWTQDADYGYIENIEIINEHSCLLELPWGTEKISILPSDPIIIKPVNINDLGGYSIG